MPNNWREEFTRRFLDYYDDGTKTPNLKLLEEHKTFIQSKFSELVDSIPDEIYTTLAGEHKGFHDWIDTKTLKEQLRKEWLIRN